MKIFLASTVKHFGAHKRYPSRSFTNTTKKPTHTSTTFDTQMLEHIACPLTKSKLRYDEKNQELICDELSVAYPIVNGIPVLTPHRGRLLNESKEQSNKE